MSKDYKSTNRPSPNNKGGAGTLMIGILIGLLLGLGLSLAVAWYINKMPTPFQTRSSQSGKGDSQKSTGNETAKVDEKSAKAESKPRFDFYKILPGSEEPATDQQLRDAQQQKPTAQAREAFYLQAGAFQNAPDADNLKARLALMGMEASVQTTTLPDKGIWHRVRVGPYTTVEDLNKARAALKQSGIDTTLIKVRETTSQSEK
jgi:cell division protein FtsN